MWQKDKGIFSSSYRELLRQNNLSRLASYARTLSFGFPFKAFTRDIWLICLSNIIGAFGEGLYFWVFPLYIRELHADYVQLGLVFAVLYGVSALAPLPGGILADRFDRKKILILSWAPWVFAPIIYSFATNWVHLIPGAICWGLSMIGIPSINAYVITSVSDKKNYASVLSFVWSSYSLSYILAPTVGGFLTTIIGEQWVLRVSGMFCAVATAIFLLLRSQNAKTTVQTSQKLDMPSFEEKRLWRKMLLWSAFFTASTFFVTVGRNFVQTFLNEQLLLSEFYVGLFGSINFAGITFIGIAIGRLGDKKEKSVPLTLCLLFHTISMLPFLFIREPWVFMFTAFIYGGAVVTGSLVSSYVGTIAPESKRGLWMSIPQTMSLLAATFAPYLGGYLYTQWTLLAFIVSIIPMPFLMFFALTRLKE